MIITHFFKRYTGKILQVPDKPKIQRVCICTATKHTFKAELYSVASGFKLVNNIIELISDS